MRPSAIDAIASTAAVSRRRTGVRLSRARATLTPNGLTDALAVMVTPIPRTWAWRDYLTEAGARQEHLGVAFTPWPASRRRGARAAFSLRTRERACPDGRVLPARTCREPAGGCSRARWGRECAGSRGTAHGCPPPRRRATH